MSPSSLYSATSLFSAATWQAALAGAGAGLLSFFVGEGVGSLFNNTNPFNPSVSEILFSSALWSSSIGLTLGIALLVHDNWQSLRGQWHRDVLRGSPLFLALSFCGGMLGQWAYLWVQNSVTRGLGWSLIGTSIGVGIGLLRRDKKQAWRGALGGCIGGFLGGFIFDGLALITSAGAGAFSRLVGQVLMGGLIALLMRVVQDSLKDASLLGVSAGPYEGKEYPLNTPRVSVGRATSNDISLFREEIVPAQLGALAFQNGNWWWQGEAVKINGQPHSHAPLTSGDTLQLGATRFRFYNRSAKNATPIAPIASPTSIATSADENSASGPRSVQPAPVPDSTTPGRPSEFALLTAQGEWLRVPPSTGPIAIGRTAQNTLVLADEGVSSRHATLRIQNGQLVICDLDSTNGTFVNGRKIPPQTPQPLQIGDNVRFGSFETTVRSR